MIIHVNFKVDDEEEPELAQWLKTLKKKERTLSYNIRQALKSYLSGVEVIPVSSVNQYNRPTQDLLIETGNRKTGEVGFKENKPITSPGVWEVLTKPPKP